VLAPGRPVRSLGQVKQGVGLYDNSVAQQVCCGRCLIHGYLDCGRQGERYGSRGGLACLGGSDGLPERLAPGGRHARDPGMGGRVRHADAGYPKAIGFAQEHGGGRAGLGARLRQSASRCLGAAFPSGSRTGPQETEDECSSRTEIHFSGTKFCGPGQSAAPLGQRAAPPGRNTGTPGQSTGLPGQNAGPSGQSADHSGQNIATPGQNTGTPGQNTGPPGQTAGHSGQSTVFQDKAQLFQDRVPREKDRGWLWEDHLPLLRDREAVLQDKNGS
jgi:hypothetical protein